MNVKFRCLYASVVIGKAGERPNREEKYRIAAGREGNFERNVVYIKVTLFLRYHAFVAMLLSLFSHAPHDTDHVIWEKRVHLACYQLSCERPGP